MAFLNIICEVGLTYVEIRLIGLADFDTRISEGVDSCKVVFSLLASGRQDEGRQDCRLTFANCLGCLQCIIGPSRPSWPTNMPLFNGAAKALLSVQDAGPQPSVRGQDRTWAGYLPKFRT